MLDIGNDQEAHFNDEEMFDYNPRYRSVVMNMGWPRHPRGNRYFVHNGKKVYEAGDSETEHDHWEWVQNLCDQYLKYESRPWFLVNGDTEIMSLLRFYGHDLEYLQNNPIVVFMYEPLFLRNESDLSFPWLPDKNEDFVSVELDWLQEFNLNHGGNLDITVYLCDYKLGELFHERGRYTNLKFKTHDIFMDHTAIWHLDYPGVYKPCLDIEKHFICLNFRHEPIREAMVAYLRGKNYQDQSYITFYHTHNSEVMKNDLGFDVKSIKEWPAIEQGIAAMQSEVPYALEAQSPLAVDPKDSAIPDYNNDSNVRDEMKIGDFYQKSFVALVNETRYTMPAGGLSEKTFNPILYMKPFIIAGCPQMIQYTQELGFRTFGDFWDESYDQIQDHAKRFDAILKIIDDLAARPISELVEMTRQMEPLLRHNYELWRKNFLPRRMKELIEDSQASMNRDH